MAQNDRWSLNKIVETKSGLSISFLRIFLGWTFFTAGMGKLFGLSSYGGWAVSKSYFIQLGIPFPEAMTFILGLIEFIGGFFLLAGIFTRLAAAPFLITMAAAILTVHRTEGTMYPFLLWVSAAVLLEHGGGKWSMDRLLSQRIEH